MMTPSGFSPKHKTPQQLLATFQEQQNITLTKQTYTRDPLQLSPDNWAFLYEQMKQRGINEKQLKKNIAKYEHNVVTLVENSQFMYFDRVSMSRQSMKLKIGEYNQQLRIRIGEMFEFISMLHLEELHNTVQCLFSCMLGTVQKLVDYVESLKQSNYRLQKDLEDWKLRKKNVLCFSCRKNVQEAKLRNLTSEVGHTTSEEIPTELTDHQHQVKKIESQCRNLQMELNAMSEEHFFNSQSDHLIEMINEVLKTRITTQQKQERKQTTTIVLSKCLSDINDMVKPLEMDYTPLESGKDIQSSKHLGSTYSTRILSIKDLSDNDQYINKLKYLFSDPLHRFVSKYQKIIESRYKNTLQKQKSTQTTNQQTQTTLIKQPQQLRNLQKQLLNLTKELNTLKGSKQKNQKELLRMLDVLQKNQSKIIQITSKSRLLETDNAEMSIELRVLKLKLKSIEKEAQAEKAGIFKTNSQEKSTLLKQIASLQQEIKRLQQQFLQKLMRTNLQSKQTQTYSTSFTQKREFFQTSMQTDPVQFSCQTIKSTKKSMLKTLRSIRLKSKPTNEFDQSEFGRSIGSTSNGWASKKSHLKSKSEIPLLSDKNSLTSRKYIREEMGRTTPIKHKFEGFQAFNGQLNQIGNINENDMNENQKRINMMKKSRKPSINNMVQQSKQNSKGYITNNNFTQQSKCEQDSLFDKGQNKQEEAQKNSFNYGQNERENDQGCEEMKNQNDDAEEGNHIVLNNFNDISNLLSASGSFNKENSVLVSKLKKMPKTQIKDIVKKDKSFNTKKKVVIKSSLDTPKNHFIPQQNNLIINPQELSRLIKMKYQGEDKEQKNWNEIGVQAGESEELEEGMRKDNQPIKKIEMINFVTNEYDHLNTLGFVNLLQEIRHQLSHPTNMPPQNFPHPTSNQVINLKQILLQSQTLETKSHINKIDIELFFSLEEASRYENRIGIWNELQSCIMVDNNFTKMTEEVDRYFQHLKVNKKATYNEYVVFLFEPFKFLREILSEKNHHIQKQRVMKEVVKLEKAGKSVTESKNFVKETFKKIIRLHKAMHKGSCRHIEAFLQKIGFYEFKQKTNASESQSPENSQRGYSRISPDRGLIGCKK